MTISSALKFACAQLAKVSDSPRLDVERLLLPVLGQTESAWLYAHGEDPLSPTYEKLFQEKVAERATGKPLAYILGEWEFWGRPFFVTPDVLIPRPETENLVEEALRYIKILKHKKDGVLIIADVGTGSGCVAITLACELAKLKMQNAKCKILATDISPAALAVAKKNAQRHGVADHIEFVQGDMLSPLAGRDIDLIVSNPPYLPAEALAKAGCSRDTVGLSFEPSIALDGGPDGQHFLNQIKNAGIPALVEGTGGEIFFYPPSGHS